MTRLVVYKIFIGAWIMAAMIGVGGLAGAQDAEPAPIDNASDDTSVSPPSGGSPSTTSANPAPNPSGQPEDDDLKPRAVKMVKPKVFTDAERRTQCSKYEGRYIAFYSEVYKVQGCQRHHVVSSDAVYQLMRGGAQIREVPAVAIAAIPEGRPIGESLSASGPRPCSAFLSKYITYSNVDVYFVDQKCVRHLLPDWETYLSHRKKRGQTMFSDLLVVSDEEFERFKIGPDFPSITIEEYAKLPIIEKNIDVIPVDEACHGVEGKIVAFYSRLYRVEHCRKRELDSEAFMWQKPDTKVVELTPEQWISLPTGSSIVAVKKQEKPQPYNPSAVKE